MFTRNKSPSPGEIRTAYRTRAKATAAKLQGAKHASRLWWRKGSPARFVELWDSKDYNMARCIGQVDPKTMEAVTRLGLWEHDYPEFHDYSDSAYEHWWLIEETED